MLSDNGSTIAFCDTPFMDKNGVKPSGTWVGTVKTMYTESQIETPFFRVEFKLTGNSKTIVWCLGTEAIGEREPVLGYIYCEVAKLFGTTPSVWENPFSHWPGHWSPSFETNHPYKEETD